MIDFDPTNNTAATIITSVTGTALTAGTPVTALGGAAGSMTFFTFEVTGPTAAPGETPVASSIYTGAGTQKPAPAPQKPEAGPMEIRMVNVGLGAAGSGPSLAPTVSQLDVTLMGGAGDADLLVNFGGRPDDLADWDCFSFSSSNEETCTFLNPVPGTYHVVVQGFEDFSGVAVNAATAVAFPDLNVQSLSVTPMSPTLSQTVDVDFVTTNIGEGPTVLSFDAQLLVDGVEAASTTVSALVPAGTANVSFTTGPLAEGDHTFTVVVDPDDVIDESNEANNTSEIQVTAVDATPIVAGTAVAALSGAASSETFFTIEVPAAAAAPAWGPVASSIEAGVGTQKFGTTSRGLRTVDYDAAAAGYTASAVITQLEVTLSGKGPG